VVLDIETALLIMTLLVIWKTMGKITYWHIATLWNCPETPPSVLQVLLVLSDTPHKTMVLTARAKREKTLPSLSGLRHHNLGLAVGGCGGDGAGSWRAAGLSWPHGGARGEIHGPFVCWICTQWGRRKRMGWRRGVWGQMGKTKNASE